MSTLTQSVHTLITASAAILRETAQQSLAAQQTIRAFRERASATTGLTLGYYGGSLGLAEQKVNVADGTIALTDNATNYVEVDAAGSVSKNTSGYTAGRTPMMRAVAQSGSIQLVIDDLPSRAAPLNNSIPAAALVTAVKNRLVYPEFSIAAESGNNIDVSIQIKDESGASVAAYHKADWRLNTGGQYQFGTLALAPTAVTVQTGTEISNDSQASGEVATNVSGLAVLRLNYSGAQTWWMNIGLLGRLYASGAIAFT